MNDKEMLDTATEAAALAALAVFAANASVPQDQRRVADTYALMRALAAVIVSGLGKRAPDAGELKSMTESLQLHCELVAEAMQAGTMQRWH